MGSSSSNHDETGSGGGSSREESNTGAQSQRLIQLLGEQWRRMNRSSQQNEGSSDSDVELSDVLPVFRMILRHGRIGLASDDDFSDDSDYSPTRDQSNPPPIHSYCPNLEAITKNDLSFAMKKHPELESKRTNTIPSLLRIREIGGTTYFKNGFDNKYRYDLCSRFLPNTVRKVATFGHKAFCGVYSKDGNVFLSASQDRAIRVYDTSKGGFKKFKKINARDVGWSVLETAFSPDGQYVTYSSWSDSIHICNIYGEDERHDSLCLCPENRRFCIFSLAFSADGVEILGGANDDHLYIYDRDLNQRVLKIFAHEDDVNSVAFADESSHILFSAGDDGLCKVWDRRTLKETSPSPVGILAGHIDGITYIDSKGDGRYLITNSKDQSIKLWDMRKFATKDGIKNAKAKVEIKNWDYRWQRVPKKLCKPRRDIEGDVSVMTYRGHSVMNTLIRCHFSPVFSTGQNYIYTGCASGQVVIYDVLTGAIVKVLNGHSQCVRDVSWHPFNQELVSTSWDNTIGLWTYGGTHALESDEEEIESIEAVGSAPLRRSSRIASKSNRRRRTTGQPSQRKHGDDDGDGEGE